MTAMEVSVVAGATTGEVATLRSGIREWPAVWMGDTAAEAGATHNVELDIEGVAQWLDSVPGFIDGIAVVDNSIVVCGTVSAVYDDGIIGLDLNPGALLVECEPPSPPQLGQQVCLIPERIAAHPFSL